MTMFETIALPFRSPKPRSIGLTMVLDKDLGIRRLDDLLETAGSFIDIVKFGWGTSRVLSEDIVRKKIELLKEHDILVCPGGTLMEVAYIQKVEEDFLTEARSAGFSCIEVSDGTVRMPHSDKLDMIKRARDKGFIVLSEVGKKFQVEDRRYSIEERIDDALKELESGSFKVIIEASESGSFGIFDEQGKVIPEFVEKLVGGIGIHGILFEAPQSGQQQWLISNLGNSVNLGNISPDGCVNLETLRCGLRAGTLREYHLGKISVFIENGIPGALAAASRKDVVIVVDAIRASTTIVTALAAGIRAVRPVSSTEECVGELTAGERGGTKIPGLMFDNSPLVFKSQDGFCGKELVLTTTNGTECIRTSSVGKSDVLIGSLINAKAVAERARDLARKNNQNITIVMAGRNNQLAIEDLISASEIVANLSDCSLKGYIRPVYRRDFTREFLESDSGKNLISLGKKDDVLFCAQKNIYDLVPEYKDGVIVNTNGRQ